MKPDEHKWKKSQQYKKKKGITNNPKQEPTTSKKAATKNSVTPVQKESHDKIISREQFDSVTLIIFDDI